MTQPLAFAAAGNRLVAITAADANDAGLVLGGLYRFTYVTTSAADTVSGAVVVRFGSSAATAADAGGDFVLCAGDSIIVRATSATIHAIGVGGTGAVGSLYASRISEGA